MSTVNSLSPSHCALCHNGPAMMAAGAITYGVEALGEHVRRLQVPLALFGLNDVTNLQLLCVKCNQLEKKGGAATTSSPSPGLEWLKEPTTLEDGSASAEQKVRVFYASSSEEPQ